MTAILFSSLVHSIASNKPHFDFIIVKPVSDLLLKLRFTSYISALPHIWIDISTVVAGSNSDSFIIPSLRSCHSHLAVEAASVVAEERHVVGLRVVAVAVAIVEVMVRPKVEAVAVVMVAIPVGDPVDSHQGWSPPYTSKST